MSFSMQTQYWIFWKWRSLGNRFSVLYVGALYYAIPVTSTFDSNLFPDGNLPSLWSEDESRSLYRLSLNYSAGTLILEHRGGGRPGVKLTTKSQAESSLTFNFPCNTKVQWLVCMFHGREAEFESRPPDQLSWFRTFFPLLCISGYTVQQ
jgi:hypothetical protein